MCKQPQHETPSAWCGPKITQSSHLDIKKQHTGNAKQTHAQPQPTGHATPKGRRGGRGVYQRQADSFAHTCPPRTQIHSHKKWKCQKKDKKCASTRLKKKAAESKRYKIYRPKIHTSCGYMWHAACRKAKVKDGVLCGPCHPFFRALRCAVRLPMGAEKLISICVCEFLTTQNGGRITIWVDPSRSKGHSWQMLRSALDQTIACGNIWPGQATMQDTFLHNHCLCVCILRISSSRCGG